VFQAVTRQERTMNKPYVRINGMRVLAGWPAHIAAAQRQRAYASEVAELYVTLVDREVDDERDIRAQRELQQPVYGVEYSEIFGEPIVLDEEDEV
jgi:hypothetical protein